MADLDEVRDVRNSLAFDLLEKYCENGILSRAQTDLFKSKYAKVHDRMVDQYSTEKDLLTKAQDLKLQLTEKKIQLEKSQLNNQKLKAEHEAEIAGERRAQIQMQVGELERIKEEKEEELTQKETSEHANFAPVVEEHRSEIAVLESELEQLRQQKDDRTKDLSLQGEIISELQSQIDSNKKMYEQHIQEFAKKDKVPNRTAKQAAKFEMAVESLQESLVKVDTEIADADSAIEQIGAKKQEKEDLHTTKRIQLEHRVETHDSNAASADIVKNRLEVEKEQSQTALLRRSQLIADLKACDEEIRHEDDALAKLKARLEKMKRVYKKKEMSRDAVKEQLPQLHHNVAEVVKVTEANQIERHRQAKLLDDLQMEVDLFIGAYLKQENLEKDQKEEYDRLTGQIEGTRESLEELKQEEQQRIQHLKFLSGEREKIARDVSNAWKKSKDAWDEVQMKELEEFDLKKKYQEIAQRQKEFCTAYEVVKNERNKYVNQIQTCSQNLSEMKEKLKILQNEVEILRMDAASKDKLCKKEQVSHQQIRNERDQLRAELSQLHTKRDTFNEQVSLNVVEIDSLNRVITQRESQMAELKRQYEIAVEQRNFTGVELIDRNDELCILHEKNNMLSKIMSKGNSAMQEKEEEIRMGTLELAEVQRRLAAALKKVPDVPKWENEVRQLKDELAEQRRKTEEISRELENPKSGKRKWRLLEGDDPDQETLAAKIHFLEERLNDKKEMLLEKDLILEEVTALSDKLRKQAQDGRADTLDLAQKVNLLRSRIQTVTRRMMGLCSECSMYQASAIKCQEDYRNLRQQVLDIKRNVSEGMEPFEGAEDEFQRKITMDRMKSDYAEQARQQREQEALYHQNTTITTAEQRVNAYIPDDGVGLPKAYGRWGPMHPTKLGSTCYKYIRKPNPKEIES